MRDAPATRALLARPRARWRGSPRSAHGAAAQSNRARGAALRAARRRARRRSSERPAAHRLEVRAHACAELAHRVAQARLRGLEADLERARDLVERQPVVVMKQEGAALGKRQLLETVE